MNSDPAKHVSHPGTHTASAGQPRLRPWSQPANPQQDKGESNVLDPHRPKRHWSPLSQGSAMRPLASRPGPKSHGRAKSGREVVPASSAGTAGSEHPVMEISVSRNRASLFFMVSSRCWNDASAAEHAVGIDDAGLAFVAIRARCAAAAAAGADGRSFELTAAIATGAGDEETHAIGRATKVSGRVASGANATSTEHTALAEPAVIVDVAGVVDQTAGVTSRTEIGNRGNRRTALGTCGAKAGDGRQSGESVQAQMGGHCCHQLEKGGMGVVIGGSGPHTAVHAGATAGGVPRIGRQPRRPLKST